MLSWPRKMNSDENPYAVVIDGVTIQCQTAADAIRLAREVATSNNARPPMQPAPRTVSIPLPPPMSQVAMPGLEDEAYSKWFEPAKEIIALLVRAGDDGLDADQVAAAAGLKSSKGSSPLLKAINKMLGVGDSAIARSRNDEGKRRWVLTSKGKKAAAKHDLPHVEAGRP